MVQKENASRKGIWFKKKKMISKVTESLFGRIFWSILIGLLSLYSCDKQNEKVPGLRVNNLCFTTKGGDISNNLRASQSWKIVIENAPNTWVNVSPVSGEGSSNLIPLIFTAEVNNNASSRNCQMTIHIGSEKFEYIIYQDGTSQHTCNN